MADVVSSSAWSSGPPAEVAVVVSTVDRAGFLPGLLAALEAQRDAPPFEVVVADDGSSDDTWPVLCRSAAQTSLPLRAVRLRDNAGAAAGRNAGVAHARAPLVAFTDDDCLPTPGWLAALPSPPQNRARL